MRGNRTVVTYRLARGTPSVVTTYFGSREELIEFASYLVEVAHGRAACASVGAETDQATIFRREVDA